MSYQPPPWSGYPPTWHPHSQHGASPDSLALGTTLGQLLAGQERSIFLHEAQLQALRSLPAQIAEMMPTPQPTPSLSERLAIVREILKTLVPLALLAAIVTGKLTWLEAWPILRSSLGIGG